MANDEPKPSDFKQAKYHSYTHHYQSHSSSPRSQHGPPLDNCVKSPVFQQGKEGEAHAGQVQGVQGVGRCSIRFTQSPCLTASASQEHSHPTHAPIVPVSSKVCSVNKEAHTTPDSSHFYSGEVLLCFSSILFVCVQIIEI